MVSFDATSLFTNIQLEETIEIILQRIYVDKKVNNIFPEYKTKDLLHLGTENVHCSFCGGNRIPTDGQSSASHWDLFWHIFSW